MIRENETMNRLIVLVAITLLAACSNNAVKTNPTAASPAPMNEAAKQQPALIDNSANTSATSQSNMSANPLTDPNNILSKRSIYFDFDKYDVKPEYRELIAAHAKYLSEHPEAVVRLEGNADERGSREYNLALGQKRAVSVKKVLNLNGTNDKQLETISNGEEKPIAEGHSEEAWSKNRRTDIKYQGE